MGEEENYGVITCNEILVSQIDEHTSPQPHNQISIRVMGWRNKTLRANSPTVNPRTT